MLIGYELRNNTENNEFLFSYQETKIKWSCSNVLKQNDPNKNKIQHMHSHFKTKSM